MNDLNSESLLILKILVIASFFNWDKFLVDCSSGMKSIVDSEQLFKNRTEQNRTEQNRTEQNFFDFFHD
jgi:hypothetical protein